LGKWLPYKNKINFLFQKYVTRGVELTDLHFENKITHAKDHIEFLQKHKKINDVSCFELGTGWYPVVPLCLYLTGAKHIFTIDIIAHLTKASLLKTIKKFNEWEKAGKLKIYLLQIENERWRKLKSVFDNQNELNINEMLAVLEITTIVGDARKVKLKGQSIDFICSNNTFEHIYPNILEDILLEFKRLIKPGGLMSHFIDMSDHFAHFDKSISIYNFLKFTEKQWKMIDNSIQPQNRMRFCQYELIYKHLKIPSERSIVELGDLKALSNIGLKAPFKTFTKEELVISHGYIFTKSLD